MEASNKANQPVRKTWRTGGDDGMAGEDGRVAVVRSISMPPEYWRFVHDYVRDNSPRISSRAHLFQLLVDMLKKHQMDPLNPTAPPVPQPHAQTDALEKVRRIQSAASRATDGRAK